MESGAQYEIINHDDCDNKATDAITTTLEMKGYEDDHLHDMPNVQRNKLQREFEYDSSSFQVCSLDITPHGCYVLAGCSNGMILLFDVTNTYKRTGYLVGHIHAKGKQSKYICRSL